MATKPKARDRTAYQAAYYRTYRDILLRAHRAYYHANKEARRAYQRAYYHAHKVQNTEEITHANETPTGLS